MVGQPGFFDLSDRYEALSAAGDPLERLAAVVDFEVFRGPLVAALRRGPRGKGGRPPFDPVLMFKILVLQALYSLSDEGTEFQIKDGLSFQRFLGLGLDGTVPDATTVWLFRERLVKAKAIDKLFARFDAALTDRGYLAMGGQIIDATVVPAPKQRNTEEEKAAIKAGRIPERWKDRPAKVRQKDRDARWSVKYTKGKVKESHSPMCKRKPANKITGAGTVPANSCHTGLSEDYPNGALKPQTDEVSNPSFETVNGSLFDNPLRSGRAGKSHARSFRFVRKSVNRRQLSRSRNGAANVRFVGGFDGAEGRGIWQLRAHFRHRRCAAALPKPEWQDCMILIGKLPDRSRQHSGRLWDAAGWVLAFQMPITLGIFFVSNSEPSTRSLGCFGDIEIGCIAIIRDGRGRHF